MNNDNLEENTNKDVAKEKLQNISRNNLNTSWNKSRNAQIIGAATKKVENKVADKLGNTRLGQKLVSPKNHQRPNLGVQNQEDKKNPNMPKNNDIGSRNLQNSLRDKANKLWQNKKKKKEQKKKEESDSSSSENDNSDDSAQHQNDEMLAKVKRRIKIKIIICTSIIGLFVLILVVIIMAIFGIDISATIPAINQSSYGTDKFTSTYEEGTTEYKQEIAYYEKIKKANQEYEKENSEAIKTSYIHATLIYLYYQLSGIDITDDVIPIDYLKMTNMVDIIVELIKPDDSSKTIDYEKNGEFYNKLKNSDDFKNYYKDILKEKTIDEILDEIFDLALELDGISFEDDTVITSETTVTVADTESGTSKKTMSINNYIADSIYASGLSLDNSEKIKASTIAFSTNIVAQNKTLTIDSNNAFIIGITCSTSEGCSYDQNGNLVNGPGERNSKNTIFYNGSYYYQTPLSNYEITKLNTDINSVFGHILVNTDGTYPTLDLSKVSAFGDGDYKTILVNTYGNYTIKNIGEDSYVQGVNYGDSKVKTEVIFYDQGDYSSYTFCGVAGATIKSSGCGVTSMAMVASTYENDKKYDPIMMNGEAKKYGLCGKNLGTAQAFFKKESSVMKYKYIGGSKSNKELQSLVLNHLAKGHLVVVRIGKGHFTGGGHYMVLGGVDPETNKVYVYDPNNKSNSSWRKTGNGWYSYNDIIVKEAYNFYIIWKE